MPAQHAPGPAAFDACHAVVLDGSPYRNGWDALGGIRLRSAEIGQGIVDDCDQRWHLSGIDLVSPNIRGDNPNGEFTITGW